MINKSLHKQKLQYMTKAVDNNPPYSYKNPLNKKSKEFKLEGKLHHIKYHFFKQRDASKSKEITVYCFLKCKMFAALALLTSYLPLKLKADLQVLLPPGTVALSRLHGADFLFPL